MEFYAFGFFVSILNFGLMFTLFYQVVVLPMERAVALRQQKVTSRLEEIRVTLSTAQKLEDEVKTKFSKLDAEKEEMRQAAEHENARIQKHLESEAERDALHLVGKTERELEKNRLETLAALNRQLTDRAMERSETLLTQAFDSQAKQASASLVLGKVAQSG